MDVDLGELLEKWTVANGKVLDIENGGDSHSHPGRSAVSLRLVRPCSSEISATRADLELTGREYSASTPIERERELSSSRLTNSGECGGSSEVMAIQNRSMADIDVATESWDEPTNSGTGIDSLGLTSCRGSDRIPNPSTFLAPLENTAVVQNSQQDEDGLFRNCGLDFMEESGTNFFDGMDFDFDLENINLDFLDVNITSDFEIQLA